MSMQGPSKRVALITGANKGIGFEIARQIGRTGVTVLLGARNASAGQAAAATLAAEGIDVRFLAIDVNDQIRSMFDNLRIPTGVVVIARAADLIGPETGLKTGDVIHSVNKTSVDSLDSLRAALNGLKPSAPVVLRVERDGQLQWLAFEME